MKKKQGKSNLKPEMPSPDKKKRGEQAKGLTRKDGFQKQSALRSKDDFDKPIFGDVGDDNLESKLDDVEAQLVENPRDRELHIRKYRVLRKLGERGKMRAGLQFAARELKDIDDR